MVTLLDHLAEYMIYLSTASSFWFSLNSSYDHEFHLSQRFGMPPHYDYVCLLVAANLTKSHRLIVPAGCCIASCRPLIARPSRHLVASAGCCIASCHPLVAPPFHPLVAQACCCIASPPLLLHRPLVLLFAPAGCCVACRRVALSLSCCAS